MEDRDGADNLVIADAAVANIDIDADTNGADNLGTDTKGGTGSNSNGNNKTRCPKIVRFSINNSIDQGYSIQLITEMMKLKNLFRFKQPEETRATEAIVKYTLDVLNFVSFLSTIDYIILSNLLL